MMSTAPSTSGRKTAAKTSCSLKAESKLYLDQVKSVLPGLLNANAVIKADFDVLSAAAQRLNK